MGFHTPYREPTQVNVQTAGNDQQCCVNSANKMMMGIGTLSNKVILNASFTPILLRPNLFLFGGIANFSNGLYVITLASSDSRGIARAERANQEGQEYPQRYMRDGFANGIGLLLNGSENLGYAVRGFCRAESASTGITSVK